MNQFRYQCFRRHLSHSGCGCIVDESLFLVEAAAAVQILSAMILWYSALEVNLALWIFRIENDWETCSRALGHDSDALPVLGTDDNVLLPAAADQVHVVVVSKVDARVPAALHC